MWKADRELWMVASKALIQWMDLNLTGYKLFVFSSKLADKLSQFPCYHDNKSLIDILNDDVRYFQRNYRNSNYLVAIIKTITICFLFFCYSITGACRHLPHNLRCRCICLLWEGSNKLIINFFFPSNKRIYLNCLLFEVLYIIHNCYHYH